MSLLITKIEEDRTLLWTGYDGFDPVLVQKELKASGMALQEIRQDKWAIIGDAYKTENEEEKGNA